MFSRIPENFCKKIQKSSQDPRKYSIFEKVNIILICDETLFQDFFTGFVHCTGLIEFRSKSEIPLKNPYFVHIFYIFGDILLCLAEHSPEFAENWVF